MKDLDFRPTGLSRPSRMKGLGKDGSDHGDSPIVGAGPAWRSADETAPCPAAADHLGDLFVGQVFHEPQHQHLPVDRAEPTTLVNPGGIGRGEFGFRLVGDVLGDVLSDPGTQGHLAIGQPVEGLAASDLIEPDGERLGAAQSADPPDHRQPDLLLDVVHVVPAQHPPQVIAQPGTVTEEQILERLAVSVAHTWRPSCDVGPVRSGPWGSSPYKGPGEDGKVQTRPDGPRVADRGGTRHEEGQAW